MTNKKDAFDHPFFKDTDNYMKKQKRKYIIISILCAIGALFLAGFVGISLDNRSKEIKSSIGKKAVIESDTMTIIDYSSLRNTYTLSNGIEYDMDFIKSKQLK